MREMTGGQSTGGRAGAERRRPITVALVDEGWMVRRLVGETLAAAGVEVVGEATSGEHAIEMVLDVGPDVVLIAIKLPGMSGVEAIQRLGVLAPASRILVLTDTEQNRVVEAIVAGASGYILKSAPPKAIISAVRATAAGESVLSPLIAGKLLERIRQLDIPITTSGHSAASAIRAALTERELDIFTRLASGHTDKHIGHDLSLSTHTVSNHVKNILVKLQLENRIQAAVQAVRAGIS